MYETNCCACGVSMYIDDNYADTLRNNHKIFYCLNGHGQSFTAKSEAEIQEEINKTLQQTCNKRVNKLQEEINKLESQEKINKLKKSKHNCNACYKTFSTKFNLNRHVKDKHKKIIEDNPKKITAEKK